MGQCVLRDMGFDFEKDPIKKQMLDDYLRDVFWQTLQQLISFRN